MPSAIVTDCPMVAAGHFPDETIISDVGGVLDLEDGTAIKIFEQRVGRVLYGPCHLARLLIERGKFIEAEE